MSQFPEDIGRELLEFREYWLVLLRAGDSRGQSAQEAHEIQIAHLRHIFDLKRRGIAPISGPVLEEGTDLCGICIYTCATREEVEAHVARDPAVISGRLRVQVLKWGGIAGSTLAGAQVP